MSRRDFLERVAIVAGAIIAAGCGAAGDVTGVGSEPIPGGALTAKLSDYTGLATVGQPVELKNASGAASGVAAVRLGPTSFLALGMSCTHEGTKVRITGTTFTCPNHGARFNTNGAVTLGPANRALAQRSVVYDDAAQTLTVT
ncbi:MAG: Rieske (2Fe-2S) protein [Gemmatimonadaceae bacterium]